MGGTFLSPSSYAEVLVKFRSTSAVRRGRGGSAVSASPWWCRRRLCRVGAAGGDGGDSRTGSAAANGVFPTPASAGGDTRREGGRRAAAVGERLLLLDGGGVACRCPLAMPTSCDAHIVAEETSRPGEPMIAAVLPTDMAAVTVDVPRCGAASTGDGAPAVLCLKCCRSPVFREFEVPAAVASSFT